MDVECEGGPGPGRGPGSRGRGLTGRTVALLLLAAAAAPVAEAKFRSLHRQQGGSELEVAFQVVMPEDLDVLRTDLYGELSTGWLGGYVAIPITRSLDDDVDVSEVGNVELGLVGSWGDAELSLAGHLGVSIESTDVSSLEELAVLAVGGLPRAEDFAASSIPGVTTLRMGVTPRGQSGPFFAQIDLGIDFLLVDSGEDLQSYHAGLGVGVELGSLDLTGEIVHADFIDADHGAFGDVDADIQTVTASASLDLDLFEPFVAYTTFWDDRDVHVVGAGLRLVFR